MISLRIRKRKCGFTLVEFIGVVSVIAIATAVATPVVTKRMDAAARDAETSSLAALSEALIQSSLNDRQLPAPANFPAVMASYLNIDPTDVQFNKRKLPRIFLAHPGMTPALPYTQTPTGTSFPVNARLILLSSVAKALPSITPTALQFDAIWNAPKNTVPAPLSGWGGRGDDLLIHRIELTPLFHKLLLMNVDPSPLIGRYSIDGSATIWVNTLPSVAPQAQFTSYFMHGTSLNFFRADNTLDTPEAIQRDTSFVYQNNRWGRQLVIDEDEIGDFGQLVDRFLQQPVPCDPLFGATQRSVVNALYDYLWGYSDWAFGDPTAVPPIPPFAGTGSSASATPQYPSYSVVWNATIHLSGTTASFADNLLK